MVVFINDVGHIPDVRSIQFSGIRIFLFIIAPVVTTSRKVSIPYVYYSRRHIGLNQVVKEGVTSNGVIVGRTDANPIYLVVGCSITGKCIITGGTAEVESIHLVVDCSITGKCIIP